MKLTLPEITSILSLAFDDNTPLEKSIVYLRRYEGIGHPDIIQAVRTLILDPSQTWTEKADRWIGMNVRPEEGNEKFWRTIWNTISEGQPWPLDEAKK